MTFPSYSTNAFNNTNPPRGGIADSVKGGALAGLVGGADTMQAGDRVKIDTTNTQPGVVKFVAADDNEAAFGVVKFAINKDVFAVGDLVEVVYNGGLAVYQVGGGTLTPGIPVALSAGYLAAVDGTHLQMGMLLDYVVANSVGRVIIGWVAS